MNILIGNLFESKKKTLVNTVNCVGVMGKGIALEFKKRYPDLYREYARLCEEKAVLPGVPYYYQDLAGTSVVMFPTKDHWRSPSRMEYIVNGLDWFVNHYQELGINSVAFPPLGCGNGGLAWEDVGPVMYRKLSELPIDIEIYAPFGTKPDQLKAAYLSAPQKVSDEMEVGKIRSKLNDKWFIILEVIREINKGKHTLHVGRVIFQKICYVLTRCGIQTGFSFVKGFYGPYSQDVNEAIMVLSNANLMIEEQIAGSQMIEVNVTDSFAFDRSKYTSEELNQMNSCIDLFCRVKNTDHAEMIATVIFAYDSITRDRTGQVTEQDVFDAVMQWKKRWQHDKHDKVQSTIRDLAMLGWIQPEPSFEIQELLF